MGLVVSAQACARAPSPTSSGRPSTMRPPIRLRSDRTQRPQPADEEPVAETPASRPRPRREPAPRPRPTRPTPQPGRPARSPIPPSPPQRREVESRAPRSRRTASSGSSPTEPRPDVETPRYGREEPRYEPVGRRPAARRSSAWSESAAPASTPSTGWSRRSIPGVEFMAVNTDLQSLQNCNADVTRPHRRRADPRPRLGRRPELGYRAAFDEQDKIKHLLKGSDMVFVAAGAGGGTGTGAAPVVARLARDIGALTVGIVTKPFSFEGARRDARPRRESTRSPPRSTR